MQDLDCFDRCWSGCLLYLGWRAGLWRGALSLLSSCCQAPTESSSPEAGSSARTTSAAPLRMTVAAIGRAALGASSGEPVGELGFAGSRLCSYDTYSCSTHNNFGRYCAPTPPTPSSS